MFAHGGHAPGAVRRARGLRARMNYPEQKLWKELRRLDVHIRRQAPIGRYVADFACHSKKVVIEVEGGVHERLPEVALRDIERTAWLETQGYTVLRFTDVQVLNDLYGVVDAVRTALALPLDGGGLGGGEAGALAGEFALGSEPTVARPSGAVHTPPSPPLPPSRGKGDEDYKVS
ncbi:MAG TPA: endonuclease domain-containing protein [Phenylobacterium sp.]|uniref:endonuclease domain-containing protein n=1 Tax=Phenylobacterium sp. TaxID=1871053 RepID=UPI002B493BAB|nr:endonuclease domain-containing protein [Phenylobacterium sp.]HKR89513.1 endonuclease domain-containing protein [Phenylobacterium sp.]